MSYHDLLQHSILDLEEINELIKSAQKVCKCQENDSPKCIPCYDREKVILHHMRLIRKICSEYSERSQFSTDDFMSDGIIGLNKAIDGFDLNQSNKFFHFATNSIRWEILAGDLLSPLISMPISARKKIKRVLEIIDECELKGETLSYSKICKDLKIRKPRLYELLEIIKSRNQKYFVEDDNSQTEDFDRNISKYHYDNEEWIYSSDLKPALMELTEYQREIIISYYGINSEEKTLRQLSKEFSQSYEKTRQDYLTALDCLKHYFRLDIEESKNV